MPHSAKAVANTFLQLSSGSSYAIDPLKMQKLIYFAHGWHLALTGAPLIDEYVEAWPYGPVVPSLYHDLKIYGSSPIQEPLRAFDYLTGNIVVPAVSDDPVAADIIAKVWEVYGKYSGLQLSDMTHQSGTPWERTRVTNINARNADINNNMIREHFIHLAQQNRQRNVAG